MLRKNVPNTPKIDHITLVLALLASSDITTTRITEKTNMLVKPMHPQIISSEIGPFNPENTITFALDDETVAAIPIALNTLAMNDVKLGK